MEIRIVKRGILDINCSVYSVYINKLLINNFISSFDIEYEEPLFLENIANCLYVHSPHKFEYERIDEIIEHGYCECCNENITEYKTSIKFKSFPNIKIEAIELDHSDIFTGFKLEEAINQYEKLGIEIEFIDKGEVRQYVGV